MFGSDDDKKTPGDAGEKKSLFGWMRKKPQGETPAAQAPATPSAEPLPVAPPPRAAGQAAAPAPPAAAPPRGRGGGKKNGWSLWPLRRRGGEVPRQHR